MALRLELGMPPVHVLAMELRDDVRERLCSWSSEVWEVRPLFRDPGLKDRVVSGKAQPGLAIATGTMTDCFTIWSMMGAP